MADRNLVGWIEKMMRTWVITDPGIYGEGVTDVEDHLFDLFEIYVNEFQIEFPAMFGKIYTEIDPTNPRIYTRDIDKKLLNIQCLIRATQPLLNKLVPTNWNSTVGNGNLLDPNVVSLAESVSIDLYTEYIQNEWNDDLEHPVILYDETEEADFIVPRNSSFIVFGFKERKVTMKSVPYHVLRPMKYFLHMKIAEVVHDAITKYALERGIALAEKAAESEADRITGPISLTPDQVSSVHIGNLSLSLMSSNSWSRVSDLLSSGAGQAYLQQLRDIAKTNRDKFNREKFIRYSGMVR